jgi:hypothetical protein
MHPVGGAHRAADTQDGRVPRKIGRCAKKIPPAGLSIIQPDPPRARATNACGPCLPRFRARDAVSPRMHRMQANVHAGLRDRACVMLELRLDVYPSLAAIRSTRHAPFGCRGEPDAAIARASFAAKNRLTP